MKLEDQVISLELAKQLKELGVKQESVFFWSKLSISTSEPQLEMRQHLQTQEIILADCTQYWAAFTVAELGYLLPMSIKYENSVCELRLYKGGHWILEYYCYSNKSIAPHCVFMDESEANARAQMLIHLIENKLIEVKDVG